MATLFPLQSFTSRISSLMVTARSAEELVTGAATAIAQQLGQVRVYLSLPNGGRPAFAAAGVEAGAGASPRLTFSRNLGKDGGRLQVELFEPGPDLKVILNALEQVARQLASRKPN